MADPTQVPADPAAAAPAAPDAPDDMSQGYVIELRCMPGGKYSIGVEPMAEEQGEESAGAPGASPEPAGDDFQPVANIGEAMKLIREIIAHAGQMTDTGASQDEMSAGYGGESA